MKQSAEMILERLRVLRQASDSTETFQACFRHVAKTSGWTEIEVIKLVGSNMGPSLSTPVAKEYVHKATYVGMPACSSPR